MASCGVLEQPPGHFWRLSASHTTVTSLGRIGPWAVWQSWMGQGIHASAERSREAPRRLRGTLGRNSGERSREAQKAGQIHRGGCVFEECLGKTKTTPVDLTSRFCCQARLQIHRGGCVFEECLGKTKTTPVDGSSRSCCRTTLILLLANPRQIKPEGLKQPRRPKGPGAPEAEGPTASRTYKPRWPIGKGPKRCVFGQEGFVMSS